MKYLFCSIVLLLLLSGPASFGRSSFIQQKEADEVLAEGNPPLTLGLVDKLVEFFEWSLESKFTKSHRTVFTTRLIQVWEKRDQPTIDGLVNVRKGYDDLARAEANKRNEAQRHLQSMMLKEFPNEPPNSLGALLLSVYKSSHPDGAATVKNQQQAPVTIPGGLPRVPADVVGEWIARRGSGSGYYNPSTGQTSGPNATIDSYKVFADGTYEHSMLMQSSLYNCTTTIVGRETGPIAFNGSTFTINPGPGTLDYKSSCSPSLNSLKQTATNPETFNWRLERNEYGPQLCLQNSKGASACYQKQ